MPSASDHANYAESILFAVLDALSATRKFFDRYQEGSPHFASMDFGYARVDRSIARCIAEIVWRR